MSAQPLYTRRRAAALALAAICGSLACPGMAQQATSAPIDALTIADATATFEGGTLVERGSLAIVNLVGTWEQMGRQYGHLLGPKLNAIYDSFIRQTFESDEAKAAKMLSDAAIVYEDNPFRIRRFCEGMCQTAGMTSDQLMLVSGIERVFHISVPVADEPKCSTLAAWGDYTNSKLLVAHNYDYGAMFRQLHDYVVVTVFHPADGSLPVATIGYAGEIYAVNAINAHGVFLELNNGSPSGGTTRNWERLTGTTLLFELLFDASDLAYVDEFFETARCNSAYIITAADAGEAHVYEWATSGMRRAEDHTPDGLAIATNHFVAQGWDQPELNDELSWGSFTRWDNIAAFAEENKGSIDAEGLMTFFSLPVAEGGVWDHSLTVYQMVVEPASLTLWLQVVDGAPWTRIDLASFMG